MGGVDKGTGSLYVLVSFRLLFPIPNRSVLVLVEAAFTVKSEKASEADCLGLIVF